jgi:hypothetical protein
MTWPLVKDPNILMMIINKIFDAYILCLRALVNDALSKKKILLEPKSPEALVVVVEDKLSHHYNLSKKTFSLLRILKEIIDKHKESSFEFRKNFDLVIYESNYAPMVISVDDVKKYLSELKIFAKYVSDLLENKQK